jgi:DNA-binding NarL/FixJ family response regulator
MPHRSVLLITSSELGWAEVRSVLHEMHEVHLVGEATHADRGVDLAATRCPDVIISATEIQGTRIRPLLSALHGGPCSDVAIVFFGKCLNAGDLAAGDDLNVIGHFLWGELSADSLRYSLAAILSSEGYLLAATRSVVEAVLHPQRRSKQAREEGDATDVAITQRERAVLMLLALEGEEELTFAEIGHRLGIKDSSVATYTERLGAKLGVRRGGRRAVVLEARHRRLLTAHHFT